MCGGYKKGENHSERGKNKIQWITNFAPAGLRGRVILGKGENMSELISREQAIDAVEFGITYAKSINKETGEITELFKESNDELREAVERIKQLPPIQPKRGRWIKLDMHRGMADHKCTACKQECYVPTCMGEPMYAYCPNCGAKMEVNHESN